MSAHLFLSRKLPARLAAMLFPLAAICGAPAHATEATATPSGHLALAHGGRPLALGSNAALIIDQDSGEMLLAKNADEVAPIASLTKLMTAMVVVDSRLPMDEELQITDEDTDKVKHTRSRLTVGTRLTRGKMLLLALMSSENRAAMSLSRNYPGGRRAFVAQMNAKAKALGMNSTHYADPAGLSDDSVSTARDLHRLLTAAYAQPLIRADSTHTEEVVRVGRHDVTFLSTNRLVRKQSGDWDIQLQKTGFTNEAGRCLVMQVKVMGHRLAMIFLDSVGTLTRFADAQRVRQHLQLEASTVASALPMHTAGVATAASP